MSWFTMRFFFDFLFMVVFHFSVKCVRSYAGTWCLNYQRPTKLITLLYLHMQVNRSGTF
jgi:hypothetical protein